MKHIVTMSLVAGAIALTATGAFALEAGDRTVRLGAAHVSPDAGSDPIAGSTLDVGKDTQLGITLGYMLTDNIGLGLLAATPFKHDIKLVGVGTVAETKHLPPTLTLQYHFAPKSSMRPFIGAGINYTKFFSEKTRGLGNTKLELDDSWGLAAEAGVDIDINDRWFVSGQLWYLAIDTKAKLTGDVAASPKVSIDPWVVMIGIGTTF